MPVLRGPVLMTGATGFLGGVVLSQLLESRDEVVCVRRPGADSSRWSPTVGNVREVECSLGDLARLSSLIAELRTPTVIHLAGDSNIQSSRSNPTATFQANIEGTWNVLEACRVNPVVGSVVVMSSDKAYGASASLPYVEDAPLRPQGPYETSKACADLIAQAYGKHFRLPVVVLRPGNFFGGGDRNWNRLVPGVIRSAVLGDDIVLRSSGLGTRDWLYVKDAADAVVAAARGIVDNPELFGEAFNVGTCNALSVTDFVHRIAETAGHTGEIVRIPEVWDEIPDQSLDPTKMQAAFAWSTRTPLQRAIEETVSWYRDEVLGPSTHCR